MIWSLCWCLQKCYEFQPPSKLRWSYYNIIWNLFAWSWLIDKPSVSICVNVINYGLLHMCRGLSCPLLHQNICHLKTTTRLKILIIWQYANHLPRTTLIFYYCDVCKYVFKVKINLSFMFSIIYLQRRKVLNKTSS